MNVIDLVLLLPIALSGINGYRKGIIIQIVSFLALIVAIIICMKFTLAFTEWLKHTLPGIKYVAFFGYLILFMISYLIIILGGKLLEKAIDIAQLGLFNRISGMLLSMVMSCFFLSLLFWLADRVHLLPEKVRDTSFIYKQIKDFAPWVISFVSAHIPFMKDLLGRVEAFFDGAGKTI